MRSSALAEAFLANDNEVLFVVRQLTEALEVMLENKGMKVLRLSPENELSSKSSRSDESDYASWLGVSQERDFSEVAELVCDLSVDCMIIDHYGIGDVWEAQAREIFPLVVAVDDLIGRTHRCDIVIDPNVPRNSLPFSGPQYASIRSEFIALREQAQVRDCLKSVLVFFGGADIRKVTHQVVELLIAQQHRLSAIEIVVVVGAATPDISVLQRYASQGTITLHIQTPHMAELMLNADLMLTTASSVNWERCTLGLPALLTTVAENQTPILEYSLEHGTAEKLIIGEELVCRLEQWIASPDELSAMSRAAFSVCDGNGVARVVGVVESEFRRIA